MKKLVYIFILFGIFTLANSCDDDPDEPDDTGMTDPLDSIYVQTPYNLEIPAGFPAPVIPADNELTEEGVLLGRMLFYDPILSGDSTMSCSTCHLQEKAFADPVAVSTGIDGISGTRNSMPLFNLAYGLDTKFTWDGSRPSLEEQALEPIENPIELHQQIPDLMDRLKNHKDYPLLFRKAFNGEMDSTDVAKALSQFMRSLISGNSRYDQVINQVPGVEPTEMELLGRNLFSLETGVPGEAECIHCHGGILFSDFTFKNNGLDEANSINEFPDPGQGGVNGNSGDYGKFKVPSLRNIALTAPYMHDGRFQTLEEVIDHYSSGIHFSPTLSNELGSEFTTGVNTNMTDEQKEALIAFLEMLTDSTFINNEAYSNPFQ